MTFSTSKAWLQAAIQASSPSLPSGQGLVLGEGLLDHFQQLAVRLLDGVLGDVRIFARGKSGGGDPLLQLALADVGAAPLHDERVEQRVLGQHFLGVQIGRLDGRVPLFAGVQRLLQVALHHAKVALQRVDPKRAFEMVLIAA